MEITKKIREIEKHLDTLADNDSEKLTIISEAQRMTTTGNEEDLAIFIIIKNRIIHK